MKIISGGQTGADQGGIIGARAIGIATGGWAPKGWKTEDGRAQWLKDYRLVQASSDRYAYRTKLNVQECDGVVVFGDVESAGSKLTISWAKTEDRGVIINPKPDELRSWVEENEIEVLMVAGNRESKCEGIGERVRDIIVEAFG